jgi:hypothetical protein
MAIRNALHTNAIAFSSATVHAHPYPAAGRTDTTLVPESEQESGAIFRGIFWAICLEAVAAFWIYSAWRLLH